MDVIFGANPLIGEQEKVVTASNNREVEECDWFLWWSNRSAACLFNWKNFKNTLLKRFHDEEEDDVYKKFVHLKQKGSVSEYTHKWEVLAIRLSGFSDKGLLKRYRCGLKEYFMEELKLYKPKTIEEARHATIIIEREYKLHKTPYANNDVTPSSQAYPK